MSMLFSSVLAALALTAGKTDVVIEKDAPKTVLFAVEELTNFLAQAFGAPVPVVSAATPGKKGFVSDGFPPPDTPQQEGDISYHVRTGGHEDPLNYDWKVSMDFADRHGWRSIQ